MDKQETSPQRSSSGLTQHALLVAWGLYACHLGLMAGISQVALRQKVRTHRPQTKVLEFLVALLAGLPHLQDIRRSAHPLDQDQLVAAAWGQAAWADYSGVSRTLQRLTAPEVEALVGVLDAVSQPFIDQEVALALRRAGRLVYDADLTGRAIASTSSSYPGAAFGYLDGNVALGYQAALVSLHSPTYGRLWLSNHLHPGDTVSASQTQVLVQAAEARTQLRPRRRTELVAVRLAAAEAACTAANERYHTSYDDLRVLHDKARDAGIELRAWQRQVAELTAIYQRTGRQPTPHCQLTRAQAKVALYQGRLPRLHQARVRAQHRLQRQERTLRAAGAEVERLRVHQQRLLTENQANPYPIKALVRLDSGFTSRENIAWLMEMGYDRYTKARSAHLSGLLAATRTPASRWQRVGGNALLTAWSDTTVDGHFI